MSTSVNNSLSRASSPESVGAMIPSTSRSHVPNRREGYVMLFDSVQNTWVRVYLTVHDANVVHVLHTAGRYGRMVRPALSLSKVSHVYCSVDVPNVPEKHALLLVLYAASVQDLLCLRLQDKRLFGEWFQGLATLWPEYTPVSPVEDLVKFKALVSPGLHSYLFGHMQPPTVFQREASSTKHMAGSSSMAAGRMASLSATCPRRMNGGSFLSAAVNASATGGSAVAYGLQRQPSSLKPQSYNSTTARRFADPQSQQTSLPIPVPSTSPLPSARGQHNHSSNATRPAWTTSNYSSNTSSHLSAQKENIPMTSRVASASTLRKQQQQQQGKIFRTVVDKAYGVAYPSPSPVVPVRTTVSNHSGLTTSSARNSEERPEVAPPRSPKFANATTAAPESTPAVIPQQQEIGVSSKEVVVGQKQEEQCVAQRTEQPLEPSKVHSSNTAAPVIAPGRTLADVVAPLPTSSSESRAELQSRLVDLEIENVTLSANVLELESTVEQLRSTVAEWRRKHTSLEQQLVVQEKHFAQKFEDEKEQLRAALMEEVKSQLCAAKEKWDAREAEYRFQIETLTGTAPKDN